MNATKGNADIKDNIDKLHLIAETLMEKETIEAGEFAELMQRVTNSPEVKIRIPRKLMKR